MLTTPSTSPRASTPQESANPTPPSSAPQSRPSPPDSPEPPTPSAVRKAWLAVKWVLDFLVAQWFLCGIGIVIGLAYKFPNVAKTNGILEAEWSEKFLLVAIIFFISGLSLPPRSLWERSLDWRLHAATQISSFLLFPTITFAIASFIRLADPNFTRFDPYAIVGMVVLGVIPTTVSSNVVMTGQAGGDQSAATIEVMLGNLLGTFLSPALLQMFLTSNKWSFGKPVASGGGGTGELYRQVIEQLGFSVFIPLFVGEVIQWIWPKQVKWFRTTFRVAKIGTLCLLGVIWSTFSTAFAAGAFQILSWETVVMLVFVNFLLYGFFSVFLFALARWVPIPQCFGPRKGATGPLFSPEITVALLFCGAAKGMALGGPVVQIMYGGLNAIDGATIEIPLVLYQAQQICTGQMTVEIMRRWMVRVKQREVAEEEGGLVGAGDVEKGTVGGVGGGQGEAPIGRAASSPEYGVGGRDSQEARRIGALEREEHELEVAEEATLRESPTEGEVETEKGKRERLGEEV